MKLSEYDYLIVGQGLAGSILAHELLEKNYSVFVIDKLNPNASSRVAAGLINPITGRRVVKSWLADELIDYSNQYYSKLEEHYKRTFFHHIDSLEFINGIHEVNEWNYRKEDASIRHFFSDETIPAHLYRGKLKEWKKVFRIRSSGWMNIPVFLDAFRLKLSKQNLLDENHFDESKLVISNNFVEYNSINAKRIIFCEGYASGQNELWRNLPFVPAKGEILTLHCPQLPEEFILLSGIFIIPLGNHLFRVGSTYEWNFTDNSPTEAGKEKLLKLIQVFVKVPFEITAHHAGVRPTVKDRRPLIGIHPKHSNVFIFNGMGTKGVLLAPYFANHFINYLENKITLSDEVNINRFL